MNLPSVVVFVRHKDSCKFADEGESTARCTCRKWLRYSLNGKQIRQNARTRSWGTAEELAKEIQRKLLGGELNIKVAPETKKATIAAAIETFITAKVSENISKGTITKVKSQLGRFEKFMAARSKFFPSQITAKDVIEYRATWGTWESSVTKQKAQAGLRGFLKTCCTDNLRELLEALKPIKLTKADKARLEPQPFTEKELKHLLATIPKTFTNPSKAAKVTALVHTMVSTGLAITDTVMLERESLRGGWLKINRQKTGKAVMQKLDGTLRDKLLAVANSNPRYIFWNGTSDMRTTVVRWLQDVRQLMEDAKVYIPGNSSHRFRDTAVDYWLGAGCSMNEVAAMLGDTVAIVEKHYAKLASARMEERLAKIPTRTW